MAAKGRSWKAAISPTQETRNNADDSQVTMDMMVIEFTIGPKSQEIAGNVVRHVIQALDLAGMVESTILPGRVANTEGE